MKKKILSEAQVKRFMGLAGIQPLNEMSTYTEEEHKEEGKSRNPNPTSRNEGLYEEEDAMEPPMPEDEEGMEDVDAQIDEDVLMDAVKSSLEVHDALKSIASSAGLPVDGEPEMSEEPPMPEPDDKEDEEDPEMGDMEDEDMDDVLKEVEMELTEKEEQEMQEEIVNEVARRVAKRIVEAKRAHKRMNEALGRKK